MPKNPVVHPLSVHRWEWSCPNCAQTNVERENPFPWSVVTCTNCGRQAIAKRHPGTQASGNAVR